MYVIAVTGGMGSGKSVACDFFRQRGAIVLDLDDIAHRTIEPGGPAFDQLIERFSTVVLDEEGRVDREKLAEIVFSEAEALQDLNQIVHPAVLKEVVEGTTSLRLLEQPPRIVVLEVPLLAEAPVFADVADTVLALEAPANIRLQRAIASGMDALDASRRITKQATNEERAALAEYVIANTGTLDEFLGKLEEYWSNVAPSGT